MAPRFRVPAAIEDLMRPPDDDEDFLYVHEVVEVENLSPGEVHQLVKGLATELADKDVLSIEEQSLFDQSYSLVRDFKHLEPPARGMLMDSMCTNFVQLNASSSILIQSLEDCSEDPLDLLHQCRSHSNAVQIYAYFLMYMLTTDEADSEPAAEMSVARGAPKGRSRKKHVPQAWDWGSLRTRCVKVLAGAVQNDLHRIFESQKQSGGMHTRAAFKMMESREITEKAENKDCKEALYVIISASAIKYNYQISIVATMIHMLHKHEHVPIPFAELVSLAENQYAASSLAVDLLRAIGQIDPSNFERDNAGADNVGLFLEELGGRLPKLMVMNLSVLMCHLDGKSYKMRNSLVKLIGTLLVKAIKETSESESNEGSRLRNEQTLLNILIERSRDTSAHTRKHVLRTWAYLCKEHAVSIGHWNLVSDLAAGRLEDNAAIVRKSALQLLGTLLEYNPFGPQLRTAAFEATYEKYKEKLGTMDPRREDESTELDPSLTEDTVERLEGDDEEVTNDPDAQAASVPVEDDIDAVKTAAPEELTTGSRFASELGGLEQTRALVASLEAALRFSKCIASTMPMLGQLLASSTIGDVDGAIQLLMVCRQFDVDGSELCIRKIMPLVFSQELVISIAVDDAFKTLYLKGAPSEIATSLVQLTLEASLGDLASIEALVGKSMMRGDITPGTLSALWNIFTFNAPTVTPDQCRGALAVLCMAAKSNAKILRSNIQNILDIGFGRWAKDDVMLARYACIALQRLSEEDRMSIRASHKIFSILSNLIIGPGLPEVCVYSATEQALNVIYELHPTPETFSSTILVKFSQEVFECLPTNNGHSEQTGVSPDNSNRSNSSLLHDFSSINAEKLSRFLFVAAHIALKHLVYIESCVKRLRKQRGDREKAAANAASELEEIEDQEQVNHADQEENISKELGLNASEDAKLDDIVEQAEKEIVSGVKNRTFLIGAIAPIVVKLCKASGVLQQNPKLKSSAVLALCKLMAIDANFCERNLQLLFTIARNSSEDAIRSNCVIALGDLALRFPNLLEPWLDHMYARVHDSSGSVRKNSVLVLSHLILNDMIKVKGHISELAIHVEDEDQRISDLVKLFFHELSKKGNNPIYNLFPDILSRLSCNAEVSQDSFYTIMQFLMGTIKKCKQMEGLIEKLCNRFLGTSESRQWQSLAYCLSQLNYTQSSLRKLSDSFKFYEHALGDDEVFGHLKALIIKTRKLAKAELKLVLNELEEKLVQCHNERKEQETATLKAETHLHRTRAMQTQDNDEIQREDEKATNGHVVKEEPLSLEPEISQNTPQGAGLERASRNRVLDVADSHSSSDHEWWAEDSNDDENDNGRQRLRIPKFSKTTAEKVDKNERTVALKNVPAQDLPSRSSPSIKLKKEAEDVDDEASTCSQVSEVDMEEGDIDAASTCSPEGDECIGDLDDASSTCSEIIGSDSDSLYSS
ncbi:hypothetical protein AXG93_3242s1100 [Marchantia polymorpha subsp. ruderalis]|uniref:Condensin-1 complex subunit CAP-D2 n=1 Tax=Marchantia polymorpha subsp. ruderalis TaxID=1480154 RepID=A0A176WGW4_MARPO|nr:hypothetical protein AXG93_3242s1100 [Marchantia polymorpha subsp. ruderalis]